MLVIGSHTRGLFRPSRVNIHAASVLGRCDRPRLGYVGGWTARYRKLFKFVAWPKKRCSISKAFWDSGFEMGKRRLLLCEIEHTCALGLGHYSLRHAEEIRFQRSTRRALSDLRCSSQNTLSTYHWSASHNSAS
jgi:hypothetical protein